MLVKIQIALYIVKQKKLRFFDEKKISKITKRSHAFKGYANSLMLKCCIL